MIRLSLLLMPALFFQHIVNAQLPYPPTRTSEAYDVYFNDTVKDSYRWLEDDRSDETANWVKSQNDYTGQYLSRIPDRDAIRERLKDLWNYPKSFTPFHGGNHYWVFTNDGKQNQNVLNIIKNMTGKPEPFLDPNEFSADGTVNLAGLSVSNDSKNLAYAISESGSDWQQIRVKNIETGNHWNDKLKWIKFSGISWKGNGFYYSRYDAPDAGSELKGKNSNHKVYYHLLGNEQKYDVLVYMEKENPMRNFNAQVTRDERYLLITSSEGTSNNSLMVQDLESTDKKWISIAGDFKNDYDFIDNDNSIFYLRTNKDAPRYRLVSFDVNNPGNGFKAIVPESEHVMQAVESANFSFIVKYMVHASSQLKQFSRKGELEQTIELPYLGTVEELSGKYSDQNVFYSVTSFVSPPVIFQYNMRTRESYEYFKPNINFNAEDYETRQVFYFSKDSTRIPMFIVHKKGIELNGNNPALLFGYGGFNISKTPEFKIDRLVFLERGGVFAMPNIRGGGEYGKEWHAAGTRERKQNVFDDFIAAAEYLIKEKYTNPAKLAIGGRSNGGLLVGAVMTQRPDLFKVALPVVGVLDMLKYHTFTIGWAWKGDYGSSETPEGYKYLKAYSPLHNIRQGFEYPATLVTTGDHDDRVVPAHSYKFIAALQHYQNGDNPVLIRIDINAGHAGSSPMGSSKPVAKQIEEQTDILSFMMLNLGMIESK